MTLQEAKDVADNPSSFTIEQWKSALGRLAPTLSAQHTERALRRFERRMRNLDDYLSAVTD